MVIVKILIYWVTGDIAELCDVFSYFYRVKNEGTRARDKTGTCRNNFSFLGWSKRFQRSKKSPGVFRAECSRTLFATKRAGSDTDKIHEKNKLTRGSKPRTSSFKRRKVGVSVWTTWPQLITILLNFCWHCYFFMEKHHISYGKSLYL